MLRHVSFMSKARGAPFSPTGLANWVHDLLLRLSVFQVLNPGWPPGIADKEKGTDLNVMDLSQTISAQAVNIH
jgi:hypothetical protein